MKKKTILMGLAMSAAILGGCGAGEAQSGETGSSNGDALFESIAENGEKSPENDAVGEKDKADSKDNSKSDNKTGSKDNSKSENKTGSNSTDNRSDSSNNSGTENNTNTQGTTASETDYLSRQMMFADYRTDNEKLLDMFINNETTAVYEPGGNPFYYKDIPHDPEDFLGNFYMVGRADLDNDGENELMMGGPYGGMYIDAYNGQVFVMAQGEGTALELDYGYYDGKAYVLHKDTSHQGRLVYLFDQYDNTGKIVDSFRLEAGSETDQYDDANATFSFKGNPITADAFSKIREEVDHNDDYMIGEYLDRDVEEPYLCIGRNGQKYIVQMSIYRLMSLVDGVGELTDEGLKFTATDPAGNPITAVITFDQKVAKVTFTDSTWGYISNGENFSYDRCSYIPQFETYYPMFPKS